MSATLLAPHGFTGPVAVPGLSQLSVVRAYLLIAITAVAALIVLTPPFQVPDEPQHFFRGYQLSEGSTPIEARSGAVGATLPASLGEVAEFFLGTSAIHADRTPKALPLRDTVARLRDPLDADRRGFADFTGSAFYFPLPYLPQIGAITLGRLVGAGPLELLYAARIANAVVATGLTALALAVLPAGGLVLMAFALLPMTLSLFASASPDAAVISSAFLFTALAVRARGRWTAWNVIACVALGATFCTVKPVYAPLLLIGLGAALDRGRRRHVLLVHAVLIGVVAAVGWLWFGYGASAIVPMRPGPGIRERAAGLLADPGAFLTVLRASFDHYGAFWWYSFVGILGWLRVELFGWMYWLPPIVVATGLVAGSDERACFPVLEVAWVAMLGLASALLVLIAIYVSWTPVARPIIDGVQGRYFLPLAGAMTVVLWHAVPSRFHLGSEMLARAAIVLMAVEAAATCLVVELTYAVL